MAITIIADVGGDTSNSYVTLAEANTFFESQFHNETWTALTDNQKMQCLINATIRIDLEEFNGDIVSTSQALEFPRQNLSTIKGRDYNLIIPPQIKMATYLLAENIAKVDMSSLGNQVEEVSAVKVGSIEVDFQDASSYSGGISNNQLPNYVQDLLNLFSSTTSDFQFEMFR